MKTLFFYFDFLSPYVFFAWDPLLSLASRYSLDLKLKPVLFAGFLDAYHHLGPSEIPPKRAYVWREALRLAKIKGIEIKGPPTHPFNPLPSLRLCEVIENPQQKLKLAQALSKTSWQDGLDISDKNVLVDLANQNGLDGKACVSKIENPAIKEKIKINTTEALQKGVFGVPTFIIDEEIFWGHDRLTALEAYLEGKLSVNETLYKNMIARPRSFDRKSFVEK